MPEKRNDLMKKKVLKKFKNLVGCYIGQSSAVLGSDPRHTTFLAQVPAGTHRSKALIHSHQIHAKRQRHGIYSPMTSTRGRRRRGRYILMERI
jgi:hypothetical protein